MLAHSSGLVFVSDWSSTGGVSVISSSGKCTSLLSTNTKQAVRPNGIALEPDGNFLLAHLGDNGGGVFRLTPDGKLSSVVTHANGAPLPPTNFITTDTRERLWITVSTTKSPRALDYRATANSGFIAVAEPGESNARIVATDLGYTNECFIDTEQSAVYVNETFARRLSRFELADDGSLSNKSTVTEFAEGTYPDGVTMDEENYFWISSIVSNRIIRVSPSGEQTLMFEDSDLAFVREAELAFQSNRMGAEHLGSTGNATMKNTSSIAFGGPDRTRAYIGNLLGDCIHCIGTSVTGKSPVHWGTPLGYLESFIEA